MKLAILATAVAVLSACQAWACSPSLEVLRTLDRLGESVVATATDHKGRQVHIWENPQTGKWTVTVTGNGVTCIALFGDAFYLTGEPT